MSRPVTVGLDGSRESSAAAEWAAQEALNLDLPLRLLHVQDWQPLDQEPPLDAETQRHWAERIPREAAAELGARYPDLEVLPEQVPGPPAEILTVAANEAEMLVLGSRGLSGLTGLLVGSVALSTVAHAERPVVLVRAGAERQPDVAGLSSTPSPGDVVLGLDLARPCDELIEFAFAAAARRGARLRVVHGWSLPPVYGNDFAALQPGRDTDRAERAASALTDALRSWRHKFPAVEVVEQAVIGRPAQHLVEAADGAGLVVVGRRTRHSPVGTHIGRVTHAVLHHCTSPVAVVPHD